MGFCLPRHPSTYFLPIVGLICLWPIVTAPMALVAGMAVALIFGNPYASLSGTISKKLLALCVIGLGAGMNLMDVLDAGLTGLGYTAVSILLVLAAGLALGRLLSSDWATSFLVTAGTAICGGSAIAALAPVIQARSSSISVAMGIVFALNALALMVFPALGHLAGLSEGQFGLWSALAIHDTSSVVGAGMIYGPEALHVGTTIKLARALWIIPLVMAVSFMYPRFQPAAAGNPPAKRRIPWFIFGFLAMAALVTFVPALASTGVWLEWGARRGLVLCLFLIGAGLSRDALSSIGLRPLIQGVCLWVVVAGISLAVIKAGWIGL